MLFLSQHREATSGQGGEITWESDTSRTRCWGAEKEKGWEVSAEGQQEGDGKIQKERSKRPPPAQTACKGPRTWSF